MKYFIYLDYSENLLSLGFLPEYRKYKCLILSLVLKMLNIKTEPVLLMGSVIDRHTFGDVVKEEE